MAIRQRTLEVAKKKMKLKTDYEGTKYHCDRHES